MKILKNNLKVIIAFIIGIILASSIAVYAATSASQIDYTTDKNAEIKNVAEALNDLYGKRITEIINIYACNTRKFDTRVNNHIRW